jgi:hypothetical protein
MMGISPEGTFPPRGLETFGRIPSYAPESEAVSATLKQAEVSRQKANVSEFYRVFDLTGRVEFSYFHVL